MRYYFLLITAIILFALSSCYRESKTFSNSRIPHWCDVAPIFYNVCGRCHHEGGIAPFSLLNYQAVWQRKSTIRTVLESNIMPPWKADTSYTHFLGEFALGEIDRKLLIEWISGGAPKGDSSPMVPIYFPYSQGSQIGEPDTTLAVQHAYYVPENDDHYQSFVIPLPWHDVKYATAIEVIPGDPQAIHHISAFIITDASRMEYFSKNKIWHYDPRVTSEKMEMLLTNWAKGSFAFRTSDSIGIKLPANAALSVQIHYSSGYQGVRDSTRINFFLAKGIPARQHHFEYINNFDISFLPYEKKFQKVVKHLDSAITMTSIWPHTHHLARNVLCFALTPSGDTLPLIKINDWDYDWQNLYVFRKPVVIPAGSDIIMKCYYDNSSFNPRNPNDPPKKVVYGTRANDEMLTLCYYYLEYHKGDEQLSLLRQK